MGLTEGDRTADSEPERGIQPLDQVLFVMDPRNFHATRFLHFYLER